MKKFLYFIAFIAALSVGWFFGFRAGLNKAEASDSQVYEALALANAAAHLRVFSEISEGIQEGRYASAKCKADLSASRLFEQVNKCIDNADCRAQLSDVFEAQIPSILANEQLTFKYYSSADVCVE